MECYKGDFRADLKELIQTSWPIILIQVCQVLISPISLMFCGHLGDTIKFDGAALAISMINCTVIAVGQGMGTACDTVFAQTIKSANKGLVGVYVQRTLILFSLALIPFYAILINTEKLLLLIGQHPETSRLAEEYVLIFIPGAWCYLAYTIFSKYLLSMGILYPNTVISVISNGINALLHYILIYLFDLGIRGSAISFTTAHVFNLILTLAYIVVSGSYKGTWEGWTTECLEDWVPMAKLSIAGMLMICMEWWAFELGLFLCGILGTTELGAQSIILQLDLVWYQVPLSIQIACSIMVGQRLGSGNIDSAKPIGWLAVLLTVLLSMIPVVLFCSIPRQLTSIFTNISKIINLAGKLLPLVAIYVTLDGIGCAFKGVITGTGRQSLLALLLFMSYYFISLPIGIPLMFLTWLRVAAFWIGLAINMFVQAVVLLIIILKTDWEEQKRLAFERNKTVQALEEEREPKSEQKEEGTGHEESKPSTGSSGSLSQVQMDNAVLRPYKRSGRTTCYRVTQYGVIAVLLLILASSVVIKLTVAV